jgi:hypothetical protein
MRELRERKRQLVAESEVYRETLRLEVQNLRLYGLGLKEKLSALRAMNPLFVAAATLLGTPLGGVFARRRKRSWLRLGLTSLVGWQVYRQVAPLLQLFLQRSRARTATDGATAEAETPAASI